MCPREETAHFECCQFEPFLLPKQNVSPVDAAAFFPLGFEFRAGQAGRLLFTKYCGWAPV
jgi:hypothetical protein